MSKRVADELRLGTEAPRWRFILSGSDNRTVARMRANLGADGRVALSQPELAPEAPLNPIETMLALVAAATHVGRSIGPPRIRVIEAQPGPDIPLEAEWISALTSTGFSHVSTYSTYQRTILPFPILGNGEPRTVPVFDADDAALKCLYARCVAETLDRRDIDFPERPDNYIDALRSLGYRSGLWLFGTLDGVRCGYILTGTHQKGGLEHPTGWLLEVGVLPEYRSRGHGNVLVGAGLRALSEAGDTVCRCVVDDANAPMQAIVKRLAWLARREAAGAVVPHHFIRRGAYDWDDPAALRRSSVAT